MQGAPSLPRSPPQIISFDADWGPPLLTLLPVWLTCCDTYASPIALDIALTHEESVSVLQSVCSDVLCFTDPSTHRVNGRKLVLKSSLMCWRCMLHDLHGGAVRVNRSHEYVACVRVLLFFWSPRWGWAQVLLKYQNAER